ncbi:MAG: NADH:ubiquinone reductase (Na(+)-transporting) subunit C [Bacteroidales bacterium]|nr:NADH:ubiquinone reductase (Na(+)-transporting) subunit C [Bacteroidales bacterium]
MKSFSNRYMYIYSTVLVVVVAAILAIVSKVLSEPQNNNIRAEQMQMILQAANNKIDRAHAEQEYNKYITTELGVKANGEIVSRYTGGKLELGDVRPFFLNIKDECKKYKAGDADAVLPVFLYDKGDGEFIYVVPVRGIGLWDEIWGYVALKSDANTVENVVFDHAGETPGLGGNIKDDPSFPASFIGKTIFEGDDFVSVAVEKRAGKDEPHKVEALTGATLTSNGVSDMLKDGLEFYVPYFKSLKK